MLVADSGSSIRVGGLLGGTSASSGAGSPPSAYARDWNPPSGSRASGGSWPTVAYGRSPGPTPSPSPGPFPQPPHVDTPAEAAAKTAAQKQELQTAKVDATLAQDVYRDPPNPPAGYHVANDAELAKLGLTSQMLDDGRSDFRARVYVGGDGRTVVAYRGSQTREDWKNDVEQGAGLHSDYYDRAIDIGQRIARSGETVTFTGHSLGGGLASASSVASGQQADTFNAAGITSGTLSQAKAANIAAGGNGKGAHVDAYFDGGDPLSTFQDANALEGGLLGGFHMADAVGSTPLTTACSTGRAEIALVLLDHGADPWAVGVNGDTAADYLRTAPKRGGEDAAALPQLVERLTAVGAWPAIPAQETRKLVLKGAWPPPQAKGKPHKPSPRVVETMRANWNADGTKRGR